MSDNLAIIARIIEDLTGQPPPFRDQLPQEAATLVCSKDSNGLGYSQFNELLLCLGYDRVSHSFFQYLVDRTVDYKTGASLRTTEAFRQGVDEFRKIAILFFGNVKFAFKTLSRDDTFLKEHVNRTSQRREKNFADRHQQIIPPNAIAEEDTYLLGYVIKQQLDADLVKDPDNPQLLSLNETRIQTIEKAKKNHRSYLISDHLDVYIATSMRERHEFSLVHKTTRDIFSHECLANLKLRWFDPTQAYCDDRIDKGLAEGLMLRRAKCTIYFAQETDTLGKDSELACTLAQGKPVIAFVPRPSDNAAREIVDKICLDGTSKSKAILQQLRLYDPSSAWSDPEVRHWLDDPLTMPHEKALMRLQDCMESHFKRRNNMLREVHPLGVQINLQTGVANGVLVVNTVDECARLVRALLLRELKFELQDDNSKDRSGYIYLKETISNSIFRVVTGDAFLTNAFWNFYLNPNEDSRRDNEQEDYRKSSNDPYDLTRSARQGNLFDYTSDRKIN